MKTKWASKCSVCGKAIPKDFDVKYDPQKKSVSHWQCGDSADAEPDPVAERKAERIAGDCGYFKHSEAIRADWPLLVLHRTDGESTAGRDSTETLGNQSSLWPVQAGVAGEE